jgi:ATP-dependent Lhr-like helicase
VVVDEWHELIGSKRGVQAQLALARLRRFNPALVTWGLRHAGQPGGGDARAVRPRRRPERRVLVRGRIDKQLVIDTLIPPDPGKLRLGRPPGRAHAAAGGRGDRAKRGTTLVFTNVRSQAEIWYQLLLEARPDWAGHIALHHGSLDRARASGWSRPEGRHARAVVCTSSLDLGVDFLPVERVLQIGSAKGVARMMQRAGRSGHAPGRPSRITLVPTTPWRSSRPPPRAGGAGRPHRKRVPPEQPLDVLVQHLVTVALGGGFTPTRCLPKCADRVAYRDLTRATGSGAWTSVRQGGESLAPIPTTTASCPTTTASGACPTRGWRGATASTSAPSSATRRSGAVPGGGQARHGGRKLHRPLQAGRLLLLRRQAAGVGARARDDGLRAKRATPASAACRAGTAAACRCRPHPGRRRAGDDAEPPAQGASTAPRCSACGRCWRCSSKLVGPAHAAHAAGRAFQSREGWHLFLYPFAGRHVHLGLASLLAWRAAREQPARSRIAINDYGFELLSAKPFDWAARAAGGVLPGRGQLLHEVLGSLNATELAQRRFREIARVAGLIFQSHPGEQRSNAPAAGLGLAVLRGVPQVRPGNRLLNQAEQELLTQELDVRAWPLRWHACRA